MSKKNYVAVAEIFAEFKLSSSIDKELLLYKFCKMFESDNENFDSGRFLTACGVEQ